MAEDDMSLAVTAWCSVKRIRSEPSVTGLLRVVRLPLVAQHHVSHVLVHASVVLILNLDISREACDSEI